jgi:hypothetical protein
VDNRDHFEIYNDTDTDCPAGGVCMFSGVVTEGGVLCVVKPDNNSLANLVVTNFFLPARAVGSGTLDNRVILTLDTAGGPCADGDIIGSQAGSFLAKKGNVGFVCVGGSNGLQTVANRTSAGVTGLGTDNHVVLWDGTGVPQIKDSRVKAFGILDNGTSYWLEVDHLPSTAGGVAVLGANVFSWPTDTGHQAFLYLYCQGPGGSTGLTTTVNPDSSGDCSSITHQYTVPGHTGFVIVSWDGTDLVYNLSGMKFLLGGSAVPSLGAANVWTAQQTFHPATDVVPVVVQGGGAGTASLTTWLNSAGAIVASVSGTGIFTGNGSGLTGIPGSSITGSLPTGVVAGIAALAGSYAYLW